MLINPNTTASMTDTMRGSGVVASGSRIAVVTSRSGGTSIEGHFDEARRVIGLLIEIREGPRAARDIGLAECRAALDENRADAIELGCAGVVTPVDPPVKSYAGRLAAHAPTSWCRSAERLEQRLEVDPGRHV